MGSHTVARQLMTADVVTTSSVRPIREFVEIVHRKRFSGLPVVDDQGAARGLVSHNDVLRALALWQDSAPAQEVEPNKRRAAHALVHAASAGASTPDLSRFLERPVSDIMTAGVISCGPDAPLAEVCGLMATNRVRRVVVVDAGGAVAGIVTATDVVRHLSESLS